MTCAVEEEDRRMIMRSILLCHFSTAGKTISNHLADTIRTYEVNKQSLAGQKEDYFNVFEYSVIEGNSIYFASI